MTDLKLGRDENIWCDIGLNELLPINFLGDGANRILSIYLGISEVPNGVLYIDEIDSGLHCSSLNAMWETVFDVSNFFNTQIFATTHSFECISSYVNTYESKLIKDKEKLLLRLEKSTNDQLKSFSYNMSNLKESIESGWEFR